MARFDPVPSTGKPTDDVHPSPAVQAVDRHQAGRGGRKSALSGPDGSTQTTASNSACLPRRGWGRASGSEPAKVPGTADTHGPLAHSLADLLYCEWDLLDGLWFHTLWGCE
jgi:hypothetical protein